jgi:hypothetical protein
VGRLRGDREDWRRRLHLGTPTSIQCSRADQVKASDRQPVLHVGRRGLSISLDDLVRSARRRVCRSTKY